MDIEKAKKLAIELRDHHGLDDWTIRFEEWTESEGIIASTYINQNVFEFSPTYFSINDEWFCKDQILHEIAHALSEYDDDADSESFDGHGEAWREKCVEIGAIPHEIWEGFHSYKSPFGDVTAHRFEGDENEEIL